MDRRRVLEIGLLLAGGYAAAVGGLYVLQDRLIFPRGRTSPPYRELPSAAESLVLETADGARLEGVYLPSPDASAPLVLGFPGNAWNAQDFALFLADCLPEAAIVAFHYRGYPPSTGHPGERALARDAHAIVRCLGERWPERPLVVVGVSIGSGVAAHVLDASEVAGAVLIVPFDSVLAVAREQYPWVPVGALLRHPFDTVAMVERTDLPIAVLSAAEDKLIRPARTAALVDRIPNLAFEHTFEGASHHSIFDEPSFPAVLDAAVIKVSGANV